MKIKEVLLENYQESLKQDLFNLLVRSKATNKGVVNTKLLVSQMQQMGYSVDEVSIQKLLADLPIVDNASAETINISGTATPSGMDSEESANHVKALAKKASKLG